MNRVKLSGLLLLILLPLYGEAAQSAHTATHDEQIAAFTLEEKNAENKVKAIVNQPVKSYPLNTWLGLYVFSPGWFHPGAIKPDYTKVDVRTTQEFPYEKHEYVTSDVSPGLMYKGADLEFNAMLKYYYTDRSVPKKKLTDAEMVEINRLYRIIGNDEKQIAELSSFSRYFTVPAFNEFLNSVYGTVAELLLLAAVGGIAYKKLFR